MAMVVVAAMLATGADCRGLGGLGEGDNCWQGLALGDEVVVELVDVYTPTGPYRWAEFAPNSLPSCEGRDGLVAGSTLRLDLFERRGIAGCWDYRARPLTGVVGVDFSGTVLGGGTGTVFAAEVPHCGGHWRMAGLRRRDQDPNPFDEEALPGEFPPVRVQRYIEGSCDTQCFDEWVGVIRHAADAGMSVADGGM